MKLNLTENSNFGEEEALRLKGIREQRQKAAQAKKWEQSKTRIFTSIKRGLTLLFMMAVVTFAFHNREQLQKMISTKLDHLLASRNNFTHPGVVGQSAINLKKDVDQVLQ